MAIQGDVLIFSVYDGLAYRPVACLTNNPFEESREVLESDATKCDPGVVTKRYGRYSYSVSLEGQYIDTTSVGAEITKASHDFLKTFIRAGTSIEWSMATGITDAATEYGTAFMENLSVDPPADGDTTFSCSLQGDEVAITTVNPNP